MIPGSPDGESYAMLAARVRPWLATVTENTVAVSHGGVARVLMVLVGGLSTLAAPNTEILQVNGADDSAVTTAIQAKLSADQDIDYIITLGAPQALDAIKSVPASGSSAGHWQSCAATG